MVYLVQAATVDYSRSENEESDTQRAAIEIAVF